MHFAALVLAAAAAARDAVWTGPVDGAEPRGVRFTGGRLCLLDKEHAALVVSEAGALVSAVFAGPGAQVRRSDEGLQATAPAAGRGELLLRVEAEDGSIEHWEGWNRSFPALVSGYVRDSGRWRLVATLRVKTSAVSTHPLRTAELRGVASFGSTTALAVREEGAKSSAGAWRALEGRVPAEAASPPDNSDRARAPSPRNPIAPRLGKGAVPLQPFGGGWGAEAERWGVPGPAGGPPNACRPPEEKAPTLPDPSTWPRKKWCGEAEGGDILPALHFWWELPDAPVNWLYNSITVEQSAPMSFFMGIGFNGGYFGIQEHNSSADRYVLFSIWDGAEVVEVLDVGRGVEAARFGLEGTGVNSHLRFPWEVNEPVELAVHADRQTDGSTIFAGYVHDPRSAEWRLLAKLRTRACGKNADGFFHHANSFLEVWLPSTKCDHRRARYGPVYFRRADGASWERSATTSFSATCDLRAGAAANLACPARGFDAAPGRLELGAAVENRVERGFPGLRAAALPAAPRPPVLAGALPFADGAPGAATAAARPLLRWGPSRPQLRPFGETEGEKPVCPWYVVDCDGIP